MKRTNDVFYSHIRFNENGEIYNPKENNGPVSGHLGITIAFVLLPLSETQSDGTNENMVNVAYSRCFSGSFSKKPDNFNRAIGRSVAKGRLHSSHSITINVADYGKSIENDSINDIMEAISSVVLELIGEEFNNRKVSDFKFLMEGEDGMDSDDDFSSDEDENQRDPILSSDSQN